MQQRRDRRNQPRSEAARLEDPRIRNPRIRDPRIQDQGEAARLNPLALTIALWLGVVVSTAAIGRMAGEAAAQANLDEARSAAALPSALAVEAR